MTEKNEKKPVKKTEKKKTIQPIAPKKEPIVENTSVNAEKEEKIEESKKKEEKKIEVKKLKKNSANIVVKGIPSSTKVSVAICKFIKFKTIETAIKDLEAVIRLKKAVPMKGEIPHRKGKIMSGRFPIRAAKEFIVLLKSLKGNANNHDVENPLITEAMANKGTTTYARGGRARKKRTNITITCTARKEKLKEKKIENNSEEKKE